jgi:hypothetical protein
MFVTTGIALVNMASELSGTAGHDSVSDFVVVYGQEPIF